MFLVGMAGVECAHTLLLNERGLLISSFGSDFYHENLGNLGEGKADGNFYLFNVQYDLDSDNCRPRILSEIGELYVFCLGLTAPLIHGLTIDPPSPVPQLFSCIPGGNNSLFSIPYIMLMFYDAGTFRGPYIGSR